jgi:outer membrane protein TolC
MERTTFNSLLAILMLGSSLSYAQIATDDQKDLYVQESADDYSQIQRITKPLSLNVVIEQGMRKNFAENIRRKNINILDNNLKDTKESFYLPNVQLSLQTSKQRLATLKDGTRDGGKTAKTPTGSLGLELGDYTVYNWGKDYLSYLNSKETIERNIDKAKEESRDFRQNLILTYTNLLYLKEITRIKKEQLRNASFIYRLNREKVTLKKVTKHDYYQARSEYLRAQQEYFTAKLDYEKIQEEIAALIDDPPGTKYTVRQDFGYTKIKMTKKAALSLAYKNAPHIKDAKLTSNVRVREYEVALRDNMPLPKLSVNLGTYKHNFAPKESQTLYETETNSNNIELVATVNATWTIFGDGGLFNKRKLANARLQKETANWNYNSMRRSVENYVINIFKQFENSHDQIKIYSARVPSLKKRMDLALNRYLEKRGRYNDFHLALVERYETEIENVKLKYNYFLAKVQLAQVIGVEELPGESFEDIIVREGTK